MTTKGEGAWILEDPRRLLGGLALVLALIAAVLVLQAKVTPWHLDADAYFTELTRIQTGREAGGDQAATVAFEANQAKHGTHKWLYADLGYLAGAWAIFIGLIAYTFADKGWRGLLRGSAKRSVVLPLAAMAWMLIAAGLFMAEIGHPMNRGQIPPWTRDPGAPLAAIKTMLALVIAPSLLAAVLPVLFVRREPVSALALGGRPIWRAVIVNAPYGLLALGSLVLLHISFVGRGSWALSVGAFLQTWLLLNGRALLLQPKSQ